MSEVSTTALGQPDGRNLRFKRMHEVILLECKFQMVQGEFRPTIVGIAKVSGASVRSIFAHFGSIEGLHREALKSPVVRESIVGRLFGGLADSIPVELHDRMIEVAVFGKVPS